MAASVITRELLQGHVDEYCELLVKVFNHQPSGVEAIRRDLALLVAFLEESGRPALDGDGMLAFLVHLKQVRDNSAGSVNRKISSVREYVRFLRFKQVDGASGFPIESLRRVRRPYPCPQEALSVDEVRRILGLVDRESVLGFRDLLLLSLLYRLGLRLGEALAVDLGDLDLEAGVVRIHGKGRRERTLPLLPDLVDLLRRWLLLRSGLYRSDRSPALLLSKKGNRLSARAAQESFQKLVAAAGPLSLAKVTPHSLRHAFASHALDSDADPLVLKSVLGHARLSSTEVYLHPSMALLRRAVKDHPASEILEDLISRQVVVLRVHQQPKRKIA
jgi:site-specific recombinase XerD